MTTLTEPLPQFVDRRSYDPGFDRPAPEPAVYQQS